MSYFSLSSPALIGALVGSGAWSLVRQHKNGMHIAIRMAESAAVGFVFDFIIRRLPIVSTYYGMNMYITGASMAFIIYFLFWSNPMWRQLIDKADSLESSLLTAMNQIAM